MHEQKIHLIKKKKYLVCNAANVLMFQIFNMIKLITKKKKEKYL